MATDKSKIPEQVLATVARGLMSEQGAAIDGIPGITKHTVTSLDGKIPALPSSAMTANKVSAVGVAEGADPDESAWQMDQRDYNLLRYPGYTTLNQGEKVAATGAGLDTLRDVMRRAQMQSLAQCDALLEARLSSATLNETQAALSGVWSVSTSTPIKDLMAAKRKVGGSPDLVVCGLGPMEALQSHPDFTSRTVNFDSSAVPEAEVVRLIQNILGVRSVAMGPRLYNAAAEVITDAFTIAYHFDGLFWLGYARDLHLVEQEESPRAEMGRNVRREADEMIFTRRIDIVRAHKEMGCAMTGILT